MTPEGLAGTGIGGRTPLTGWGGVQIENLGRIGRNLRVGAASRLGVQGGMDARRKRMRRPDCVYRVIWTLIVNNRGVQIWGCRADWTPVGGWRGVQIAFIE